MNIKTILGIEQPYGQNRIGRNDSGDAPSVSRGRGSSESESSSSSGSDRVTLSDGAKLVALATNQAKDTPEVRSDKVAVLRAQVEAGTYQPDSKKIAEKMLTMESDLFG